MTARERAACVIGWPVRHSRSPRLHRYWLERYGIDGDYRAEEVRPEDFATFLSRLEELGYVGANVTLPHKQAAFALSEPDARARAVGASNTLWLEAGRLRSTNTDVEGFIGALDQAAPGWDRRRPAAVVLGAGGSTRAVVCGLLERGVGRIHVVNRTHSKAEAIARQFGPAIHPAGWDALPRLLGEARLLVNTTSLGMTGQPPLEIDLAPMPPDAIVSDIVYVPLRTTLLGRAEARGLAVANGLDMLIHQAVRGFELWFGRRPEPTRALYDLLAADI